MLQSLLKRVGDFRCTPIGRIENFRIKQIGLSLSPIVRTIVTPLPEMRTGLGGGDPYGQVAGIQKPIWST